MVQLIQSNQLSGIPGSAGRQQVIQDTSPTLGSAISGAIDAATGAYDAAGTIYAKNQAQSLVGEELENVDSAIAIAEKKAADEDFVAPDDMPVSSSEFTVIENAVRSGAMSREKARLLASSRLRTRIAEQPMFADKLRQAASQVVGFNIQSEPAQQYFAAFQTNAQLAQNGVNDYRNKLMQEASAKAPIFGVTTEEMYKELVMRDEIGARKEAALARQDLEGADNIETFTEINQENSKIRFTNILGTFKEQFGESGSVDEAAAEIILAEAEAQELAELEQIWTGDQTSTEFGRARDTISASYDQIRDYADAVGYDNLNKIGIQRAKDARTMLGDELFSTEKMLAENLGQQVSSQAFETLANITQPSRLEQMFRSNPTLGRVGAILGNPTATKAFGGQMSEVYKKIAGGQPIEDQVNEQTGVNDADVADTVLADMFSNAGEEGENAAINYLKEQGREIKPLSLLVTKAPGRATEDSKKYFQAQFKNSVPVVADRLATVLATNPALEWEITDSGKIEIVQPQPSQDVRGGRAMQEDIRRTQRQMAAYNQAQEQAEHLNLYADGISKGWGSVVESSPGEYRRSLAEMVDSGFLKQSNVFASEAQSFVLEGDIESAKDQFSNLQRTNPNYKNYTFEQFQEAIRRRNNLGD